MNHDYDILIVGGGMVGASMACALAPLPLRIGVIEAFPFRSDEQPSYDVRAIALAHGSQRIMQSMHLWEQMQEGATPIKHIHISDRGHFGVTRLHAEDEGVPALGYVVESRFIGKALQENLDQHDNVELTCPAKLRDIRIHDDYAEVDVEQSGENHTLNAKLVIAADGGNSVARQCLEIDTQRWEYGQTAVICTVSPSKSHENVAYERFTDSGPLALLPLSENRCSVVYTVRDDQVEEMLGLNDAEFLARLQERFGYRLGRFTRVSARKSFPLALSKIKQDVGHRVAFIGNAAHTVHPVAGQGFNLGIRDVAALAEIIEQAQDQDFGSEAVLQRYSQWRQNDHRRVFAFTDGLARIFSNPLWPVRVARSKGLALTDMLPPLKRALTRQAMGIHGKLPKLGRGLRL